MTRTQIARGRIIRIVDPQTVIIDLGSESGIEEGSIFRIVGKAEEITDPETKAVLGTLAVVKGKVRASQVHPKFTIATSKWTSELVTLRLPGDSLRAALDSMWDTSTETYGKELRVDQGELEPWKAESEEMVRVGDPVEVDVPAADAPNEEAAERTRGE